MCTARTPISESCCFTTQAAKRNSALGMRERAVSRVARQARKYNAQAITPIPPPVLSGPFALSEYRTLIAAPNWPSNPCLPRSHRRYNLGKSSRPFVTIAPIQQPFLYSLRPAPRQISSTPPHRSNDLARLENYIADFRNGSLNGSWGAAWEVFTFLPEHLKTPSLTQALISLLASSPHDVDTDRIVELFDSVAPAQRQPDIYPLVVERLITANRTGKALVIADAALAARINPNIAGIDDLLFRFIHRRQWQFVFRVYERCYHSFQDRSFFVQWRDNFFRRASSVPDYATNIYSMLTAIRDFPNSFSPEADRHFVYQAVTSVLRKVPTGFTLQQKGTVLSLLAELRLVDGVLYDLAISSCLRHSKADRSIRLATAFEIYQNGFVHRGQLDNSARQSVMARTRNVVCHLLRVAVSVKDKETINHLFQDWRDQSGFLDHATTGLFIHAFTSIDDPQNAINVLQRFVRRPDGVVDKSLYSLPLLFPVLRAFAARGDPAAVYALLKTMQDQMGVNPDVRAYNILLNAYQKNDDLEGALRTFNQLLEAGLEPDNYTYGSLMFIAGRRGDSRLLKRLRRSAWKRNIKISAHMNESMIVNLLTNGKPRRAQRFGAWAARKFGPSACTSMYNLILAYYSSKPASEGLPRIERLVDKMKATNVPLNVWTYSRLMRAYTNAKLTMRAHSILYKVLLPQSFPVTAFHFAIVMDGYAQEQRFDEGMNVHAEMLRRGIKPDFNSKYALMKLVVLANEKGMNDLNATGPFIQADLPDELLQELLDDSRLSHALDKGPVIGSGHFSTTNPSPAAYVELLLSMYEKKGAHNMIESLIQLYERRAAELQRNPDQHIPIALYVRLMRHSYNKSDHEQVDIYWQRIKGHVKRISETAKKLHVPLSGNRSEEEGQISLKASKNPVMGLHRNILSRPLDIYMQSLRDRSLDHQISQTVQEIVDGGFTLDSTNWNNYISHLAEEGLLDEAFSVAERHLVPSFRELVTQFNGPNRIRTHSTETEPVYRGPRITYNTMILLGEKLFALKRELRRSQLNPARVTTLIRLQNIAPRLWHAIHRLRNMLNYESGAVRKFQNVPSYTDATLRWSYMADNPPVNPKPYIGPVTDPPLEPSPPEQTTPGPDRAALAKKATRRPLRRTSRSIWSLSQAGKHRNLFRQTRAMVPAFARRKLSKIWQRRKRMRLHSSSLRMGRATASRLPSKRGVSPTPRKSADGS